MTDEVSSVPVALAARAGSSPHDPWLFHREGLDWRWHSWSRVAEQVARGAEALRLRPSNEPTRVGFDVRQNPDAIVAGLAIRAAGCVAEALPPGTLIAAARRLDRKLAPSSGTPIVCAAPDLDLRTIRLVEAWTVLRGAAWVLEPDRDAFVETVLWARPTLVFGRNADLEPLTARLRDRKHRRYNRLAAIVVAGGEVGAEVWNDLGVRIVALPLTPDPSPALPSRPPGRGAPPPNPEDPEAEPVQEPAETPKSRRGTVGTGDPPPSPGRGRGRLGEGGQGG